MDLVRIVQILVLAVVQGLAELLPVSSSAHVTVVARLIGYNLGSDPNAELRWAFLLIMLHTGTMFSVLVYFWSRWKPLLKQIPALIAATAVTAVVALALKTVMEKASGQPIEHFFRSLPIIAVSLAAVGPLIILAGIKDRASPAGDAEVGLPRSAVIGVVQGLCLPFRGFSRSGSTISTGMLMGIARIRAEEFSFALAVLLTPPLIGYSFLKLIKQNASEPAGSTTSFGPLLLPGLLGMCFSFGAGLIALRWLSRWLEKGRWTWFGYYCLAAAVVVLAVNFAFPAA
jgi:undecaprenyl-diphosphatase